MKSSKSAQESKLTPMMAQWHACKEAAGDAILLFRMGDFYEAFYEDAALLAKNADLTLTKRQEIPMSGVPWHSSDAYIDKLISKGFRVAIAEQLQTPKDKECKGIIKREIVRIITPGTVTSASLLSEKSNNFIASLTFGDNAYGFSFIDVTTSEFKTIELSDSHELLNEFCRIAPSELLLQKKVYDKQPHLIEEMQKNSPFLLTLHDDWHFQHQVTYNRLKAHFRVHNLDGFGLKGMNSGVNAAGALLAYLQDSLSLSTDHIGELATYSTANYMSIGRTTQLNLELTEGCKRSSKASTLLSILDDTLTPMGARLLKQWIDQPLLNIQEIQKRQDAVEAFVFNTSKLAELRTLLEDVKDIERLISRISSAYATPRDLVAIKTSLQTIPSIKESLSQFKNLSLLIKEKTENLHSFPQITDLIDRSIIESPPCRTNEGGFIKSGFHQELDELRELSLDSKSWIARYQTTLRETSGIKTLKVGYTRAFGYFVEVSKGQSDNVPSNFLRRQTLTNGERYTTSELKSYEAKVITAEEKCIAIESELFTKIRQEIAKYALEVSQTAQILAVIDAIQSLAHVAHLRGYQKPVVDEGSTLKIDEGRHPVIEALNVEETFVANDTLLDNDFNRLLLITGPNMAGKSTYIRQVALLVIMAQMGSFIPAKSANIGVIDRLFTRIGANDDLSRGQSTFMVEMTETANILNHLTPRSLILLDEIGRGTSTYDGISIAWSVAEHLLSCGNKTAKTLFATHYWELTKLEEKIDGAVNYTVAVHEGDTGIVFLRKIIKGSTDKSYGIHVGKLAGLPSSVVNRAEEILLYLEKNANQKNAFEPPRKRRSSATKKVQKYANEIQLTFFG